MFSKHLYPIGIGLTKWAKVFKTTSFFISYIMQFHMSRFMGIRPVIFEKYIGFLKLGYLSLTSI